MLIFLDIKTTGFEEQDKICALALVVFDENECEKTLMSFVNESKKISAQASSTHHITNEMIKSKPSLRESDFFDLFQTYNREENSLVMHNAAFVLEYLKRSGLKWHGKIIDTQRVVKHTIQECELFSLEFLFYELRLYHKMSKLQKLCGIKDALCAYNPLYATLCIKLLFDYLKDEQLTDIQMQELSFENVLLEKFPFGKYGGRFIEEIALKERSYLVWMLSLENLDDDLRYSLEYYLQG